MMTDVMTKPHPPVAGDRVEGTAARRSTSTMTQLRRAPSFRADKDFDWGDRSQQAALHTEPAIPRVLISH